MGTKDLGNTRRRRMISTQLIRFDHDGMTVEGTLITKEQQTLGGNEVGRYVLDTDEGTLVINGTVQLDEAMARAEIGQEISIIYNGETKTAAGWTVKNFQVFVIEGDATDG